MKLVTIKETQEITLYPLSDLHLGSPDTDLSRVNEVISLIREDSLARVVILGDLLESAIINSVGSPYKAKNLDEEVRLAVEVLRPIKDKIIGIVSGNHEARISRTIGLDILALLTRKLGIYERYSPDFLAIKISYPKTAWYVVLHHGVGGGKLKGGKILNLHRMGMIFPNSDVILVGHTHDLIITADEKFVIDRHHSRIKKHKTFYINVPSLSMEYGGYASAKAFLPSVNGLVKIKFPSSTNLRRGEPIITLSYLGGRNESSSPFKQRCKG